MAFVPPVRHRAGTPHLLRSHLYSENEQPVGRRLSNGRRAFLRSFPKILVDNLWIAAQTLLPYASNTNTLVLTLELAQRRTFLGGQQHGAHFVDNSDFIAIGCRSPLAVQQELGLWAKRRHWLDSGHSLDPLLVESVLD